MFRKAWPGQTKCTQITFNTNSFRARRVDCRQNLLPTRDISGSAGARLQLPANGSAFAMEGSFRPSYVLWVNAVRGICHTAAALRSPRVAHHFRNWHFTGWTFD
jgi:hypothetical protein